MLLEEADGFAELFRMNLLPYYFLMCLPILVLMSPQPCAGSHEFTVYRMQHFDLHGVHHGSRSVPVNLEARSLSGWSTWRHCVLAHLQELSVDHLASIRSKAGALLVVLPQNATALSVSERQHLQVLEEALLMEETPIPVYFAQWSPQLDQILRDISYSFITDEKAGSAAEAMLSSVSANGYQIVVGGGAASLLDVRPGVVYGKLVGQGVEGQMPTVVLVAHYDAFGAAPELSFGADSNASGVAVLLELVRLFSHLYSSPKTHGKYNIVFALTGGGKLNYHGSKKWLEDQLDSLEGSVIQDAAFVACLDSVGGRRALHVHVSKPPKEGSPAARFYEALSGAARARRHPVDAVHKKINLADELLAWEHERFSIRRLAAFTLSAARSPRDQPRRTIFDTAVDAAALEANAALIAEALARHIYNLTDVTIFGDTLKVEQSALAAWTSYLASQPRSPQLLSEKQNPLVASLRAAMVRYLKDVKVVAAGVDKREPEFAFYDGSQGGKVVLVNVYSVKPAVFDLVLTLLIVAYLVCVYGAVRHFPALYTVCCDRAAGSPANSLAMKAR